MASIAAPSARSSSAVLPAAEGLLGEFRMTHLVRGVIASGAGEAEARSVEPPKAMYVQPAEGDRIGGHVVAFDVAGLKLRTGDDEIAVIAWADIEPAEINRVYRRLLPRGEAAAPLLLELGMVLRERNGEIDRLADAALRQAVRERVQPGDTATLTAVLEEYAYRFHPAYALNNTRVSCSACVLANRNDLHNGIAWQPDHFRDLVELELTSGFSFQHGQFLADLRPDLLTPNQRERLSAVKAARATAPTVSPQPQRKSKPQQLRLL